MFRKILCGLAAVGMAVALSAPAMAGEGLGAIRVTLSDGGVHAHNGSVMLYQVGTPLGPDYGLTDTFGSGIIKGEDAMSPLLAKWLAEAVEADGHELPLNEEGSAEFSQLPEGLYLLVQGQPSAGFQPLEPLLIQLPCEYQWHVQAFPMAEQAEVPATGQPLAPYIGGMGMLLSGSGLLLCRRRRR